MTQNSLDRIVRPRNAIFVGLTFFVLNTAFDSTLVKLWQLRVESDQVRTQISSIRAESSEIRKKISQAKDPAFLLKRATDRFDLLGKEDLLFVFSEN